MSITLEVLLDDERRPVVRKLATDPAGRARLRHEAELLEQLAHPGVVELIGLQEDESAAVLTLRWAGSRTVADLEEAPVEQAAGFVAALATTIADLHDRCVVHGRLDPSHVIVGDGGRPIVCGLGGASRVGAGNGSGPPRQEPASSAEDVADLGRLLVRLAGTGVEPEPIPDGRRSFRRRARWTGYQRGALLTLADHAMAEDPRRRPSARQLAASLAEAVPGARPLAETGRNPNPRRLHDSRAAGAAQEAPAADGAHAGGDEATGPAEVERGADASSLLSLLPPYEEDVTSGPDRDEAREPERHPTPSAEEPPPPDDQRPPSLVADEPRGPDGSDDRRRQPASGWARSGISLGRLGSLSAARSGPADWIRSLRPTRRAAQPHPRHRRRAALIAATALGALLVVVGIRGTGRPTRPEVLRRVAPPPSSARPRPAPSSSPPPTRPPASPPTTSATRRCPMVRGLKADVDGDGCAEAVRVSGSVIDAGGVQFAAGRPGDRVALIDWSCRGEVTPVVLRPSTGEVFVFPHWATAAKDLTVAPTAVVNGATGLRIDAHGRCPRLRVERGDRRPVTVHRHGAGS